MKKRIVSIILSIAMILPLAFSLVGCVDSEFTVKFDGNGGTLVSGQEIQVVTTAGDIEAPEYKMSGFIFDGWNKVVKNINTDTIVTAVWSPMPRSVITFNGNGGTLVNGEEVQSITHPEQIVEPVYERTGYTFVGWDVVLEDILADTLVTAKWAVNEYTLTFDANGGVLDGYENGLKVTFGQSVGTLPVPTRDDYKFVGWVNADDETQDFHDGMVYNFTQDTALKALWVDANSFVITYTLDGGDFGSAEGKRTYSKTEADFTLVNPTKRGHEFIGWTGTDLTEPTLTVTIAQGSTGDREYTANWQVKTFTVALDANGGTCEKESLDVTFGTAIGELPSATKTEERFLGWFYNDELVTAETVYDYDEAITLTAKYSTKYLIKYQLLYVYTDKDGTYDFTTTVDGKDYVEDIELDGTDYIFRAIENLPTPVSTNKNDWGFTTWIYISGQNSEGKDIKVSITQESTIKVGECDVDGDRVITLIARCRSFWTPNY